MKKLFISALLAASVGIATAQLPNFNYEKQPTSAIPSMNEGFLKVVETHGPLTAFDTSGTRVYTFHYREGKEGLSLSIRYEVMAYGKDIDLGKPGTPGIDKIIFEGSLPQLFPIYKAFVDPTADFEAIKKADRIPSEKQRLNGNHIIRFYRLRSGEPAWRMEFT